MPTLNVSVSHLFDTAANNGWDFDTVPRTSKHDDVEVYTFKRNSSTIKVGVRAERIIAAVYVGGGYSTFPAEKGDKGLTAVSWLGDHS